MAILGAIVGIVIGFAIGAFFTEVVFANNASWPDVIPFALAVLGGLAGHQLGRQLSARRADRTRSA
ncbi:MAG TPA: hypothetical protein VEG40_03530 [Gaiellaceae bacterium]|nr:hypothetical protein [Gaiellaceae bacterium]